MISVQQQLHRQWLLTLLVILLPLLLLADFGVREMTSHYILDRLDQDAESLISAMNEDDQGVWHIDYDRLGSLYQRVYSGHYFAIHADGIDLHSRSLWDHPAPDIHLGEGEARHWQQPGVDRGNHQEAWLSYAQGIRINDHTFTVWVAEDISPLKSLLQQYRIIALALLSGAMLALLLLQRRQLRSAFSRLQPLQQQLRELRFGERNSLNSGVDDLPQEVQPLAEEIDRLLILLQERVSRSRNALGNLAHEMKRPLQQLQLMAEQLSPQQQQQQRDILQRLQTLIQRELKRARIVGLSSPGRQTRLDEELPPLIQILRQLYPQTQIYSDYPPGEVMPQDRDDMLELLGNLLDNACKYAAGDIHLSIARKDNGWQLEVSDNGPGIDGCHQKRLLQRGERLDEQGPDGSGLGLAIAQDIVKSYGGEMQLNNREPRGLRVTVFLPQL
ncbi:MAG: histidine kinase [Oceanospirillaceae bacterium]|uniref:sensor histidine kinase n=1 Tax=unclassified Thalassolituus TaxID=2624967 RepID=UPI000C586F2E|nr:MULTISPECIES: HAMP domain-containing sensor histidine kinase [unclassified Thalassolituus]MAS24500.1 histidine kinase [Oceanospirillaceae bacterium]MAX98593.1 histidine kinase [Oceanospirillaceae bacterium]MBS51823.1 histidine kinase [Oceanospirillaceae bacterium]|tara:strand:+ start:91 stop:1422 length:1332 start_codon:yes stop_codon:yes gene_type:complete